MNEKLKDGEAFLKDIGLRMKEVRKKLNLKQKELAAQLKTSVVNLSDIERGKKRPGFGVLAGLSKKYKVNIDYIVLGEGPVFRTPELDAEYFDMNKITAELESEPLMPYGDFSEDVREVLVAMKQSRLVLSSVMSFAKEYLLKNEEIIRKDIEKRLKSGEKFFPEAGVDGKKIPPLPTKPKSKEYLAKKKAHFEKQRKMYEERKKEEGEPEEKS